MLTLSALVSAAAGGFSLYLLVEDATGRRRGAKDGAVDTMIAIASICIVATSLHSLKVLWF